MSTIIELIKVLRERTGAGMMDCKRALENNDLDVEKAIDWLREKGITKAATKSNRIAAEGLAAISQKDNSFVVYEVNCETDFVSRSDKFINLVKNIGQTIWTSGAKTLEDAQKAIESLLGDAVMSIGEKITLRRLSFFQKKENQFVGEYIHMEGKIATVVVIEGGSQALADGLAMSVTANNPSYITEANISSEDKAREVEVQKQLMAQDEKLKDKPEAALAKILEAKVAKVFREQVLVEQAYILSEDGQPVKDVLAKEKAKVIAFDRLFVGEGLQKRCDNFADEVLKQVQ